MVTDAVHARGGYMVCQLWHVGRFATSHTLSGRQALSASATNSGVGNRLTPKGLVPSETAKEMTFEDIRVTREDFVHAARCAVEAGFDGVEIVCILPSFLFCSFPMVRGENFARGSIEGVGVKLIL